MVFFIIYITSIIIPIIASWNGQCVAKDHIGVHVPRRKSHPKKECKESVKKAHDTINGEFCWEEIKCSSNSKSPWRCSEVENGWFHLVFSCVLCMRLLENLERYWILSTRGLKLGCYSFLIIKFSKNFLKRGSIFTCHFSTYKLRFILWLLLYNVYFH